MRFLGTFQSVGEVRVRVVGRPLRRLHHLHHLRHLRHPLGVVLRRVAVVLLPLFLGVVPQGSYLGRQTAIVESEVVRRVGLRDLNPWHEKLRGRPEDLRPLRAP